MTSTSKPQPVAVAAPDVPLTTAQIVARCEPSVAFIKGKVSSGTGFLVRSGVVATNAHVIDHEFLSVLEVRFPSGPVGQQGPSRVELLYEDTKRDLALLAVKCGLPPLEIAPSYRFVKGEDITVIGNPGLGEEMVLENAISRGVMSSRTVIDGLNYLQLSIAINPGNSGGPVFDSVGRVIGVATLKSTKAESLAFCIPVEDVHAALIRNDLQQDSAREALKSRRRAHLAFRILATAGAIYSVGLNTRASMLRAAPVVGPGRNPIPNEESRKYHDLLTMLEEKQFSLVRTELPHILADASIVETARRGYEGLAANYEAMRDLYANPIQPANLYESRAQGFKEHHLRLVKELQGALGVEVPANVLAILESRGPAVDQPPSLFAEIIPPPMLPHFRGFPGPFPRVPFGPGLPGGFDPAEDARSRLRELRERTQQQMRDMQERARSLRPPFGS